jgi:hypothetical protein
LRDLCVRWSFGRCFEKCTMVFKSGAIVHLLIAE